MFDQGAFYLQWFGHASRATWSNANVFDILEPAKFQQNTDASWPFTASYSCWSGYFISIPTSPHSIYSEQTVAEALLLTPGRGSIADFSPTGLHVGSALQKLNQGLVNGPCSRTGSTGPVSWSRRQEYYLRPCRRGRLICSTRRCCLAIPRRGCACHKGQHAPNTEAPDPRSGSGASVSSGRRLGYGLLVLPGVAGALLRFGAGGTFACPGLGARSAAQVSSLTQLKLRSG